MIVAYKLVRLRKNGTFGSLFCNRRAVLPVYRWLKAESHPARGLALRPGWRCCAAPVAPHLSKRGRVWVEVHAKGARVQRRPASQGGTWYVANRIMIVGMA